MHAVEAFRDLADEGKSVADIAARFGTTETIVRRLALGRVSPRLLEACCNEDMILISFRRSVPPGRS